MNSHRPSLLALATLFALSLAVSAQPLPKNGRYVGTMKYTATDGFGRNLAVARKVSGSLEESEFLTLVAAPVVGDALEVKTSSFLADFYLPGSDVVQVRATDVDGLPVGDAIEGKWAVKGAVMTITINTTKERFSSIVFLLTWSK